MSISPERKKEIKNLVVGVALVAILTPRVSAIMEGAWSVNFFLQPQTYKVIEFLPLFEAAIPFPMGLYGILIVAFLFDDSKRLQRPIAFFAVILFVYFIVFVQDRWIGELGLVDFPAMIFGVLTGVFITLGPKSRNQGRSGEYQSAAYFLFGSLIVFGFVSMVELYASPPSPEASLSILNIPAPGSGLQALLIDSGVLITFLFFIGSLIVYKDSRQIFLLGPGEGERVAVFCALRKGFTGKIKTNSPVSQYRLCAPMQSDELPDSRNETLELKYLRNEGFSRWVSVMLEPIDIDTIQSPNITMNDDIVELHAKHYNNIFISLILLISNRIDMDDDTQLAVRLVSADHIIFTSFLSDFEQTGDQALPEYVERYTVISDNLTVKTSLLVFAAEEDNLDMVGNIDGMTVIPTAVRNGALENIEDIIETIE